jgi:lipopolysaccharide export system protein LptA
MSLIIVVIAYCSYSFAVVPFIEPNVEDRPTDLYPDEGNTVEIIRQEHREKLKHLFEPGSWELEEPLIVQSEQGVLLIKSYDPQPDGTVSLNPCTLIFTETKNSSKKNGAKKESGGVSRPVVVQAPDGAILRFDKPFDLNSGRIGRLVGGRLDGVVTISSPESSPGAADQLLIQTRHIQIDTQRIWSPNDVTFQFGNSGGRGRELNIALSPPEKLNNQGLAFGGAKMLQIRRIDQLLLYIKGSDLFQTEAESTNSAAITIGPVAQNPVAQNPVAQNPVTQNPVTQNEGQQAEEKLTPVNVSCTGPFEFDFKTRVATLNDNVRVVHQGNDPQRPHTLSCNTMRLYFDQPQDTIAAAPTMTQERVAVSSTFAPNDDARTKMDLSGMKVRQLVAEGNVILDSPATSGRAEGDQLLYDVATQAVQFSDSEAVTLTYVADDISITGRRVIVRQEAATRIVSIVENAVVQSPEMGRMTANGIHIWLRPGQRIVNGVVKKSMVPERILAVDNVTMASQFVTGRTNRLEAYIQHLPARPLSADLTKPSSPSVLDPNKPKDERFDVTGQHVRLQITRRGKKSEVDELTVTGAARFVQTQGAKQGEELYVAGDQLRVLRATSPDAEIHVAGNAVAGAQGIAMSGPGIQVHRLHNRMWINGPGKMTIPAEDPRSPPMVIQWGQRMQFDGQTAQFDKQIVAQGNHILDNGDVLALNIQGNQLDVVLDQRVNFSDVDRKIRPQIAQLKFPGDVVMRNRLFQGQVQRTQDQVVVKNLRINQQTNQMFGDGPGWVTSVHRGGDVLNSSGAPNSPIRPASTSGFAENNDDQLNYLRVDFEDGLRGNMSDNTIEFFNRIRAIYGPVDSWNDVFVADRREQLGKDGFVLTSQKLNVALLGPPVDGEPAIEMKAIGAAIVESSDFTARADRISYERTKDLLVIEGGNRSPAQIWQGDSASPQVTSQRIVYSRKHNRIQGDIRRMDLSQFGKAGFTLPKKTQ